MSKKTPPPVKRPRGRPPKLRLVGSQGSSDEHVPHRRKTFQTLTVDRVRIDHVRDKNGHTVHNVITVWIGNVALSDKIPVEYSHLPDVVILNLAKKAKKLIADLKQWDIAIKAPEETATAIRESRNVI